VVACSAFGYAARRLPTKCRDSRPEAVPLHSNDHAGPVGGEVRNETPHGIGVAQDEQEALRVIRRRGHAFGKQVVPKILRDDAQTLRCPLLDRAQGGDGLGAARPDDGRDR
jgi:hypothetical protein